MIKLEVIEEKYYFHIQRDNIDKKSKWNVGDQLSIGSYENYYYKNFNTRKLGIKLDEDFQYAYRYIDKIWTECESIEFDETIKRETLNKLRNVLNISHQALKIYTQLVRELVYEGIRKEEFPEMPSRTSGIWVCSDIESLKFWRNELPPGRVLGLKLTGKTFRGNNKFLGCDTYPLDQYKLNARKYWSGVKVKSYKDEILFEGEVEVNEILEFI